MHQQLPTLQSPQRRRLKVYERIFLRSSMFGFSQRPVHNPEIRLCGKWLEESGFAVGSNIQVLHEHGRIVITIEK
jgi:hypothetical protein